MTRNIPYVNFHNEHEFVSDSVGELILSKETIYNVTGTSGFLVLLEAPDGSKYKIPKAHVKNYENH